MSLNYNFEDIANGAAVTRIKRKPNDDEGGFEVDENGDIEILNPRTEILIFMSMVVKIGKITKENAGEFYARAHLVEAMDGAWGKRKNIETGEIEDRPITVDDVYDHIGLRCNVVTESREEFFRSQVNANIDGYINTFVKEHDDCEMGEDFERIQLEREEAWL